MDGAERQGFSAAATNICPFRSLLSVDNLLINFENNTRRGEPWNLSYKLPKDPL